LFGIKAGKQDANQPLHEACILSLLHRAVLHLCEEVPELQNGSFNPAIFVWSHGFVIQELSAGLGNCRITRWLNPIASEVVRLRIEAFNAGGAAGGDAEMCAAQELRQPHPTSMG